MLTHSDIKKKFLIEYDKANITSSYPSLTDYEIATILDKAYLALIAQKVTGNNPRQAGFETDNKAIADIQPLVITTEAEAIEKARMNVGYNIDSKATYSFVDVTQVTHELATKYMCTTHNKPWVETPVCYMEDNKIITLVDPILHTPQHLFVTYIKKPKLFVENLTKVGNNTQNPEDPGNTNEDPANQDDPTDQIESAFILGTSVLNGEDKLQ